MVQRIPLTGERAAGRFALVDDADLALVADLSWHASEHDYPGHNVTYARAYVRGSGKALNASVFMHTRITGWPKVDHRNNDGLDNQRHNLRQASTAENAHNARSHAGASSQFKGVNWDRWHRKWRAEIRAAGVSRCLGYYAAEETAALAYDAAARDLLGEFARLNFP